MSDVKAIEVHGLTKIYNSRGRKADILALDNFSINVEMGQIFGLLGPNGAGKTTFIKILLGIANKTAGDARMLGREISEYSIRSRIGYLPENHKYPAYLNAEEILVYFAKLSGYESTNFNNRMDELLQLVKMDRWKKVKIKKYSKGMMQRLGLALSIINDPDIIFLDEPTDGVDPIGRKEIRDILKNLRDRGKTVFINSHLLSEVELISDKVVILHKGKLVKEGSVEELTTNKEIYEVDLDAKLGEDIVSRFDQFQLIDEKKIRYAFKAPSVQAVNSLIDSVRSQGINIVSLNRKKFSLEEMFIDTIKDEEKNRP